MAQSLVNADCLSEVLITSRMPEKTTMSYDGVLCALTITQGIIRLKLVILSKIRRDSLKYKREGNCRQEMKGVGNDKRYHRI